MERAIYDGIIKTVADALPSRGKDSLGTTKVVEAKLVFTRELYTRDTVEIRVVKEIRQ